MIQQNPADPPKEISLSVDVLQELMQTEIQYVIAMGRAALVFKKTEYWKA